MAELLKTISNKESEASRGFNDISNNSQIINIEIVYRIPIRTFLININIINTATELIEK